MEEEREGGESRGEESEWMEESGINDLFARYWERKREKVAKSGMAETALIRREVRPGSLNPNPSILSLTVRTSLSTDRTLKSTRSSPLNIVLASLLLLL